MVRPDGAIHWPTLVDMNPPPPPPPRPPIRLRALFKYQEAQTLIQGLYVQHVCTMHLHTA